MQPWNGRCPDCNGEGWFSGPEGGACINLACATDGCGARINVARIPGGSLYERIDGRPEKVILLPVPDPDEARLAGGGGSLLIWVIGSGLLIGIPAFMYWLSTN